MIASEFEHRHRSWFIALVFALAYSFYNLDHLNAVYALLPSNVAFLPESLLVRLIYAGAALLGGFGAAISTWATAYRPSREISGPSQGETLSTGGPYRYVRNPHYLGNFLLLVALGSFQSRWGVPVLIAGEALLFRRLVGFEEMQLEQRYGDRFRDYCRHVSRFLPSLRPRMADDTHVHRWRQALMHEIFQWGWVATLIAFACTLSDPIGCAFGGATIGVLALQKLVQPLLIRLRRT